MMFSYGILPCRTVYVGIDFRRKYALMSQHLLDGPEVGTILHKMRGERMTERMRGYLLVYSGCGSLLLYHLENIYTAQ